MIVGVLTETKSNESRVALMPIGARQLCADGHEVLVQSGAGLGSGFRDEEYEAAGAVLTDEPEVLIQKAQLLVKVKEPQEWELELLGPQHVVFGYLHLAGAAKLAEGCIKAGFAGVAYETLADSKGGLPLLTPMSEVAGRLSVQAGARHLERPAGGSGTLLGGVPGVEPGHVAVLGAGVVGTQAAQVAAGLGAKVTLLDVNLERLRWLSQVLPANVTTRYSDPASIEACVLDADLVIGSVLLPGRRAPKLLTEALVRQIRPGSVLVDVCIDQGGCAETSRATSHASPTYLEHGVVHYCVPNMPGAVGRTSTPALCNATLPYVRRLAKLGLDDFLAQGDGYRAALNCRHGKITNPDVAADYPDLPTQ